ncbi:MAG TPA: Ig-like domain-containing protein [Dictyoglomaceae bacterium]|nr:Ig-like domain-containing protein [Dictyoglomaceae bacterium]
MKNKFLLLKISIVFLILMFLSGCVPKDTTPPSVSITSPLNNATVSGSVDIIASATDDVGVSKVEFYIDGTKVGEDSQAPYEYSWNTDSLQYGSTHSIKAKAYDNAGNTGESQIVTVTIGDTQAPQVTITNPNDGDTVSGIVSIEAQVVDKIPSAKNKKVEKAPSGISKVEFYVDGTKVGEDSQAPYEYSWNTDSLQYGSTHSIKAKAYDNAGNTGESQIVTVTIGDPQAPQVTITNPNNGDTVSGIVSIEAQVVDKIPSAKNKKVEKAPSGISKVEFYVDGTKVGEATQSPYVYSWNTTQVSNGGHTIKVKAYDNAGNSDSATITVYVNNSEAITWQKTYGGSNYDEVYSIQKTNDGGYIAAGTTNSFRAGSTDVYVLKLDENGNVLWQKTFGGINDDWAYSVQQTTDGGYIVAGYTVSIENGYDDVYVLKLDSDGKLLWEKTYGGTYSDWAYSIQQTNDGGYIVAGWTYPYGSGNIDAYILKLDSDGELEWYKSYGGSDNDWASSIQQTTDGGYIVAGWTGSSGAGCYDVYVLKLDENGELEWQKTFGGSSDDYAYSIQQVSDGGYIVAGYTASFGTGYDDVYVLKLNTNGDLLWQKTFGESGYDRASSIQQTIEGGYIVAGYTDSFGAGYTDVYILKLDANGNLVWQKIYGGSDYDYVYSIQQTNDGGYIAAGLTASFGAGYYDAYVLKLDASGNTGPYPTISKFQLSPSTNFSLRDEFLPSPLKKR